MNTLSTTFPQQVLHELFLQQWLPTGYGQAAPGMTIERPVFIHFGDYFPDRVISAGQSKRAGKARFDAITAEGTAFSVDFWLPDSTGRSDGTNRTNLDAGPALKASLPEKKDFWSA
jgi:hypothetical protein